MRRRIALLGIYHETNTFSGSPTQLADFKQGFWLEREEILTEYRGAHHEISGIIEVLEAAENVALIPVLYAYATPGGLVEGEALQAMLARMFQLFREEGPYDGVMVVPHGAGVSAAHPDMDGYWLGLLRKEAGDELPIVGTLDPHANVSPDMVRHTQALLPYATNPHIDQAETGRKAARLLLRILMEQKQVVQRLVQLPLAISIEQQYTSKAPCLPLLAYMEEVKAAHGLLHIGLLLGFPYADVKEMGAAFILIGAAGYGNLPEAEDQLRQYMKQQRDAFIGAKKGIAEWIPQLKGLPGPILLLDMGDNVGGGSSGRSTVLLEALDKAGLSGSFHCILDPVAVEESRHLQPGDVLAIGENRYAIKVSAVRWATGRFTEAAPRHGGFVNYDMGKTAIVETASGQTVMLTSLRTLPYSLRQLTAHGLDPLAFRFIVAKGVNAPIAAYRDVCSTICQVDTPGDTSADMTRFVYHNRRRPLFPFETA